MDRKQCIEYMFNIKKYYNLLPETLALSISLFDICYPLLAGKGFDARIYRAACMSVASKYEEMAPPSFRQLGVYTYENDIMTNAELSVLQACGYCVSNIRHPVWHINNMCILRDARYYEAIELALGAMLEPACQGYAYFNIALESWRLAREKHNDTFWPNLPMREAVSA